VCDATYHFPSNLFYNSQSVMNTFSIADLC